METVGFAVIATGVIFFALISKRLETTIITAPMIFAAFGLLIGEGVFGIAELNFSHGFIHGLAELTLILVLFSDAARIDLRRLRIDHNLPMRMLLIGMPLTIMLGTLAGLLLPLGLSLWGAALLAAILAPTDAALGQSVISNPLVPARIRQALNIESGLNDGIALPLVLLFASFAGVAQGAAVDTNWFLFGAKQIILGPVVGIAIGGGGAWLLDRAANKEWMTKSYEGAAVLGVALLAYAGSEIVGGNGFIASFVSGMVFGTLVRGRCGFLFEFAEAQGQLLVLLTFLIFGAAILPLSFGRIDWMIIAYAIASLTVIRMVPVAVSLIGSRVRLATVAFLGWFGPRGLASILFAIFVMEDFAIDASEEIMIIMIVTVTMSMLAHGLSAAPAARRFGTLMKRAGQCEETKPVSELPTRTGMQLHRGHTGADAE